MPLGGYKIRNQFDIHFLTCTVVQWVDVFTRPCYADIVVDSLRYCQQNKGLLVHAWCLMPNHLHLIASAGDEMPLSGIMRDFKKFTSHAITTAIKENHCESRKGWMSWIFKTAGEANSRNENVQFWLHDNHPVECSGADILFSRIKYLHENPLRAGLVWKEEHYRYSSAIDYYGTGKGLLEIAFIQ